MVWRHHNVFNIQLAYNWRMDSVWMAYGQRIPNVLLTFWESVIIYRFPFFASHTQSTLVIRLSYVGDTIMHFEGFFVRMKIILLIFIRNSYVSLIRYSVIPPLAKGSMWIHFCWYHTRMYINTQYADKTCIEGASCLLGTSYIFIFNYFGRNSQIVFKQASIRVYKPDKMATFVFICSLIILWYFDGFIYMFDVSYIFVNNVFFTVHILSA